ncbi:hypothetical protein I316_04623 [Kwoniella heveanensis BCC8398]|uniref:Cytochrome P450 n=1 Tax=Kwoniella heveanensis BCC8398 TaxID=1296120 RepID=A0A1B9GR89_9TREE|nr:hypothetical protein I316_04623 [Kwoniella heveanensis BCC8398]
MATNMFDSSTINQAATASLFAVSVIAAGLMVYQILRYAQLLWHVRGLPSIPTLFMGFEPGTRTRLPHIPWVCPVKDYTVYHPWLKYQRVRSDLIALPSLLSPSSTYITSSPSLHQFMASKPHIFHKPLYMKRYTALDLFGRTVLSTQNGPEYRRHSSIIKRCLGDRAMEDVWDAMRWATEVFVQQDIENEMSEGGVGVAGDIMEAMNRLTLLVIGRKGFGIDFPWNPVPSGSWDSELPFRDALHLVEKGILLEIILPPWLLTLIPSRRVKRYLRARKTFMTYLTRMYEAKNAELTADLGLDKKNIKDVPPPSDLLGALVHSQLTEEEETRLAGGDRGLAGLKKSEIIGNMWILIFAGHETTGSALSFTLAYLALYPEWQDKVYEECKEACGGVTPTYRDMHKLPLAQAVWQESLRLRDIVSTNMKHAVSDVVIPHTTWTPSGEVRQRVHLVKKGSLIIVDSSAAQLNPFYWGDDALTFNPLRHIHHGRTHSNTTCSSPSQGQERAQGPFVAFSLGQRQCIGKRFAETEMTCFVNAICATFRFSPVKAHSEETWDEMHWRLVESATEQITYQPGKFSLRFERRQR